MKSLKIVLFMIICMVAIVCFNDNVYAAEATKCVYKLEGVENRSIVYKVTPNGKGGATLADVELNGFTAESRYEMSTKLGENYVVANNFIKDKKLSCPSILYYQIQAGDNYAYSVMDLSFVKDDLPKVAATQYKLTDSTNNNQVLTTEEANQLIRSCEYNGVKIVGSGVAGQLTISAYKDGTLEYVFSNNKYKVSGDDSVTSSDFTNVCPEYYVGCGCDGSNCYCNVTKDNVVNPDYNQSGNETEAGEDIEGGKEYDCSYKGQIKGQNLIITKYAKKWIITYPSGVPKIVELDKVGSNVFPSSDCEDIFYSAKKEVIKTVKEDTSYTNVYVSQYCSKYDDLEQFCHEGTCKIDKVACGSESETNQYGSCPREIAPIILFLKKVVMNTLQIFVPIILIIMATLDLVKAVMATDEKAMQEAMPKIIRRFLAAILMVFVTTIVSIVMNMIATTDVAGNENNWKDCWTEMD